MKHRGEVLSMVITQLNVNRTKLAKRMGYDRSSYYTHIKKPDLDYSILWSYGKAIPYDFTKEFPEMSSYIPEINKEINNLQEMRIDRDKWRDKYYEVLEKYNALLEKRS